MGKCLLKHQTKCKSKLDTLNSLRGIDKQNDFDTLAHSDYFLDDESNKNIENIGMSMSDDDSIVIPSVVTEIKGSMNIGSFHILHLNINSIFNKFEHIFSILDLANIDVIALNEIKLDESIPDKTFMHQKYNLLRKDRSARGGGLMIYIKKCYEVMDLNMSEDFEIISLKLKLNKYINNFVFAYKPPSTRDEDFIEYLDTMLNDMNLNHDLYVIGDLNMNWLCDKGARLREFCLIHNLKNFVEKPTRVQINKNNYCTSSLIDVVLHNGQQIDKTEVIDFAFSDHKMVLVICNIDIVEFECPISKVRRLNDKNIESFVDKFDKLDLSYIQNIDDVDNAYCMLEKEVLNVLDIIAPLKETKFRRKHTPLPWFDKELANARRNCEKLFKKSRYNNENRFIHFLYLNSRQEYQSLLRKKDRVLF